MAFMEISMKHVSTTASCTPCLPANAIKRWAWNVLGSRGAIEAQRQALAGAASTISASAATARAAGAQPRGIDGAAVDPLGRDTGETARTPASARPPGADFDEFQGRFQPAAWRCSTRRLNIGEDLNVHE